MTRACLLGPASDHMACDSAGSHDMLQVVPLPLEMRSMLAVKMQDTSHRISANGLLCFAVLSPEEEFLGQSCVST